MPEGHPKGLAQDRTLERILEDCFPGQKRGPSRATPLDECPAWPPDVFAVAARYLTETGAYTAVVEPNGLGLDERWPERARAVGREWRRRIDDSAWEDFLADNIQVVPPPEVSDWWRALVSATRPASPVALVVQLLACADEASAGVGFSKPDDESTFLNTWRLALAIYGDQSVCLDVAPTAARVLPKQHTPQRGLTIRSLSHHLALLPQPEVQAFWQQPLPARRSSAAERMNILCLPWPLRIERRAFGVREPKDVGVRTMDASRHRFFEVDRRADASERDHFAAYLEGALRAAQAWCDTIDAVVLPELGLDQQLLTEFSRVAAREGFVGVSGVALGTDEQLGDFAGPRNLAATLLPQPASTDVLPPMLLQSKHHRWCLDRAQVRQYGLSGRLPSSIDLWEHIEIHQRQARFVTISDWLTFTTLICEDLARQEPMASTIRAIGPNLVFALLMDGPQLRHRWGPRYACALAEDPGSSVCILTSLGLTSLSAPRESGAANRSRVVGLWKDVEREVELELAPTETALVLHVDRDGRAEFTADGRMSDAGFFPILRDFHGLVVEDGGGVARCEGKAL